MNKHETTNQIISIKEMREFLRTGICSRQEYSDALVVALVDLVTEFYSAGYRDAQDVQNKKLKRKDDLDFPKAFSEWN